MPWNQVRYKRHPGCLAWPLTASGLGSLILGLYPDVCGRPHLPGGGARDLGAGSGDVAEKLFACTVAPERWECSLGMLVTSLEPTIMFLWAGQVGGRSQPPPSRSLRAMLRRVARAVGSPSELGMMGMILGPTSLLLPAKVNHPVKPLP